MVGRYTLLFDDAGRPREFTVLAESMSAARVAAKAISSAREMTLRKIVFVRVEKRRV